MTAWMIAAGAGAAVALVLVVLELYARARARRFPELTRRPRKRWRRRL